MDPKLPVKLDLTLNEADGVLAALGELPSKSGAFTLIMKIQAQIQAQLPKEEPKAE